MSVFDDYLSKVIDIRNVYINNFKESLKVALNDLDKFADEHQDHCSKSREPAQRHKNGLTTLQRIHEDEVEDIRLNADNVLTNKSPNSHESRPIINNDNRKSSSESDHQSRRLSKKRGKEEVDGILSPEQDKRPKRNASVKAQSVISKQAMAMARILKENNAVLQSACKRVNVNLTQKLRREDSKDKKSLRGLRNHHRNKENEEPIPVVEIKQEKLSISSVESEPLSQQTVETLLEVVKQEVTQDEVAMPPPAAPIPKPRNLLLQKDKSEDTTDEESLSTGRSTRTKKQLEAMPPPPPPPAGGRMTRANSRASTRASTRASRAGGSTVAAKPLEPEEPPADARPKRTRTRKKANDVEKDAVESGLDSPAQKPRPKRTRRAQKAAETQEENPDNTVTTKTQEEKAEKTVSTKQTEKRVVNDRVPSNDIAVLKQETISPILPQKQIGKSKTQLIVDTTKSVTQDTDVAKPKPQLSVDTPKSVTQDTDVAKPKPQLSVDTPKSVTQDTDVAKPKPQLSVDTPKSVTQDTDVAKSKPQLSVDTTKSVTQNTDVAKSKPQLSVDTTKSVTQNTDVAKSKPQLSVDTTKSVTQNTDVAKSKPQLSVDTSKSVTQHTDIAKISKIPIIKLMDISKTNKKGENSDKDIVQSNTEVDCPVTNFNLDDTRVIERVEDGVENATVALDKTVVLHSRISNQKGAINMNETVVIDNCTRETIVLDKQQQQHQLMDATVVIEKCPQANLTEEGNELVTDDSSFERAGTPPRTGGHPCPTVPQPSSAVKIRVKQFEELASRETRTKTRAMAKQNSKQQIKPQDDVTPPNKTVNTMLSTESLNKMNNMIFRGNSLQLSNSKLNSVSKHKDAAEDAKQKKEALLQAKRDQQKKKREDKMAAAAAARIAAEKERVAAIRAAELERSGKMAAARHDQLLQRQRDVERKKLESARKAAETEERRRLEETARRARLAEEQRRADEQRRKQREEAEAMRKEATIMAKEIEKRKKEYLEKQKIKRAESGMYNTPLRQADTPGGGALMEPVYMHDGFQYLNSDSDSEAPARPTPAWSTYKAYSSRLRVQARVDDQHVRRLFNVRARTIDLRAVFPHVDRRHLKRTSSAVWRTPPAPAGHARDDDTPRRPRDCASITLNECPHGLYGIYKFVNPNSFVENISAVVLNNFIAVQYKIFSFFAKDMPNSYFYALFVRLQPYYTEDNLNNFVLKFSIYNRQWTIKCNQQTWLMVNEGWWKDSCFIMNFKMALHVTCDSLPFACLYNDTILTDFIIHNGYNYVKVHKAVLAASMPELKNCFREFWYEGNELYIHQVSTSTLINFKEYIYFNILSEEFANQLLMISRVNEMYDFEQRLTNHILRMKL